MMCMSDEVIFAYEVESVFYCIECKKLFHKKCCSFFDLIALNNAYNYKKIMFFPLNEQVLKTNWFIFIFVITCLQVIKFVIVKKLKRKREEYLFKI